MHCERSEASPENIQDMCTDVEQHEADALVAKAASWVAGRDLSKREGAVLFVRDHLTKKGINAQMDGFFYAGSLIAAGEVLRRDDTFYSETTGKYVALTHNRTARTMLVHYMFDTLKTEE